MSHDTPESPSKGYGYHLTDEALLKYMQWSIETRLTWLEEANRFLFEALPEETKKIREQLRKGDV
jgi:hypothetical protein